MDSEVGEIYWVRCPDDSRYFRTVRIANNPLTGHQQSYVSNPVMGVPPDGMKEIPTRLRTRVMSLNNVLPHTY